MANSESIHVHYYSFCSNILFRLNYLLVLILVLKSSIIISNSSKSKDTSAEKTSYLRNSQKYFDKLQNTEYLKNVLDSLQNSSVPFDLAQAETLLHHIYGTTGSDELTRNEQLTQISQWLSGEDNARSFNKTSYLKHPVDNYMRNMRDDPTTRDYATAEALRAERIRNQQSFPLHQTSVNSKPNDSQTHDFQKSDGEEKEDNNSNSNHNYESNNEEDNSPAGTQKSPPCAHYGRYYCSYKEDYPSKVVTEVTKYYKWPLEKLFRDLRHQVMPTLANDNSGGLVCDSITRIVRPGWSKNTNGRWLVVINTDHYQQYVTEIICRHGTGSYCNFIPPCYHSSCRQRYNTQKLLVIDPWNPYKGPFLSEFLFPSCCVCYIPGDNNDNSQSGQSGSQGKLTGAQSIHYSSTASGTVSSIDKSPQKSNK